MKRSAQGQIVIGAVILLVIIALLVPAIISYVQNEAKWTVKEQQTTRAFQLAEAAVERGFQQVILSTVVWNNLQAGGTIPGYHFDQAYSDQGGEYEVNVTSGTGSQTCIITGVGRDPSTKEVRAVRTIYGNSAANSALYAQGGITLNNNPAVEWGAVLSPNSITTTQDHPRFYSAGNISGKDPNGAIPPNSDNKQWWSYYSNLPPAPQIDLQAYLSSATAQGVGHVRAGGTYSMKADICAGAASCTGVYYFSGDTILQSPSAYVSNGAIVVMGDLTLQGSPGNGNYPATLPTNAWKEYGNDWVFYRATYDVTAPVTFPGINGSYAHGVLTKTIDNVLVHGFLYSNGRIDINGGGNMSVHGSLYIANSSSLDGSHVKVYFDENTVVMTKNVSLARASWSEVLGCGWIASSTPTCPN